MPRRSSSPSSQSTSATASHQRPQRLQRLLATAGFGSRRQCEELIELGRVEVDGEIISKLGTTVDPQTSKILVDGTPLRSQKLTYYAVNKPVGVVTTNRDPHGRPRVIDLVPPSERVFPVGRLDRNSEGLILLTNDGDLAQKLTHPRYGVKKVYRVTVAGRVDGETMRKMRKGIYIAEGLVRVDGAKILKARPRATDLEIVLREGKNREIRRILARFGHKVQQLRRIAVGPLRLGDTPPGAYRILTREEIQKLRRETQQALGEGSSERSAADATGKKASSAKRPPAGRRKTARTSTVKPTAARGTSPQRGKKGSSSRSSAKEMDFDFGKSSTVGRVIGDDTPLPVEAPPKRSTKKRVTKKAGTGARKGTKRTGRYAASEGRNQGRASASGKLKGKRSPGKKRKP